MAQINLSTGAFFATVNVATARQFVQGNGPVDGLQTFPFGYATVITKGVTGFDVVQADNATVDALLQAATPVAPFLFGVDDIYFLPLKYPEPSGGI
jgi:hypothetical protein